MRDFSIQAEIICKSAPHRINEDAYYFYDDGRKITALVADGVTERLQSTALQSLLTNGITSATYAAWMTRDTLEKTHNQLSPEESLLAANNALNHQLCNIYGEITPEAIIEKELELHEHLVDPRCIRLVLPATVASLFYIENNALSFAHVGDSAIFVNHKNGEIKEITHKDYDPVPEDNPPRGVRHNYVDLAGNTHPSVGVGVINGQPELEPYVQTGTLDSLAEVKSILICSDGMLWPAIRDKSPENKDEHVRYMIDTIDQNGLYHYYNHLRKAERNDPEHERFPRVKTHDDSTGIYIRFA